MTEVEALLKISTSLEHVARAIEALVLIAWLTLIFKNQSPSYSIDKLTATLKERLSARHYVEVVVDESKTTNHR